MPPEPLSHRFGETRGQAIDAVIGMLADRQHGCVARWQLRRRGVSSDAIQTRLANGRLRPIHRGVYLVGHLAAAPLATYAGAVLACGRGAVVSHLSAAAMFQIHRYQTPAQIWVSQGVGDRSARPGLRVVRAIPLDPSDLTVHERIPVVTPARAILEIAAIIEFDRLESACAEAHAQGLAREPDLRDQVDRNPGRRGIRNLRLLLDRSSNPARTRSVLEKRLLRIVRASNLPEPETNQWVETHNVDLLWRRHRLIVEADSYAFHSHSKPWARDLRKSNDLQLLGYRVLRFTWNDVTGRPEWVVGRIASAIRHAE